MFGDAAQVYVDGVQVGNLYKWTLFGVGSPWRAMARKYRLAEEVAVAEFRFFLGEIELRGEGRVVSTVEADGHVHRDAVFVEGSRIWQHQTESSLAMGNGRRSAPTQSSGTRPRLSASPASADSTVTT